MEAEEFPIDVCSCPYAYCCSCSASKTYLWWSPIMRKSRRNKNALSVAGRVTILIAAILLPLLLTSCGKQGQEGEKKTAQKNEDDFLDKKAKPEERKYLLVAKPFFIAVASRNYPEGYALLSSHAKARMSLNQFTPAQQDADFQRNESYPMTNVTAEQFAYLMQDVEAAHGAPRAPKMLNVFSTDPDVLNRRSKKQFVAMDSMFAIGAMPDWIPADIRRASLRVKSTRSCHRRNLQMSPRGRASRWKN